MGNVTTWGLFGLGIMTSLSPCSLALLVAALSFIISEEKNLKEGISIGITFTLGMSFVFFILGLFTSKLGQFIRFAHLFYIIAGIFLVLFGLGQLGVYKGTKIKLFAKSSDGKPRNFNIIQRLVLSVLRLGQYSKILSAFILGILFALGWAPCAVSLIMPVTLLIMSQDINIWQGGGLLFMFGLGHGVPIIPLAALSVRMRTEVTKKLGMTGIYLTKIFGAIILAIGILFIVFGPKLNLILGGRQ